VLVPQRFGRFWLHEKVAQGGMAELFRASIGPDPDVYTFDFLIKRLQPGLLSDPQHASMFAVEKYLGQVLRHPNLVQVYEAGEVEGSPYLAMEYVRGVDLRDLMRAMAGRGLTLPADLCVHTGLQLLRGLDYIHRARAPGGRPLDIVHRDFTPSNLHMSVTGEVKIGDFGIAYVPLLAVDTNPNVLAGKAGYMPPEVLRGGGLADQQLDLWSFGVCLYQMLAGRHPYGDLTDDEIIERAGDVEVTPLERVVPLLDKRLVRFVGALLHANPMKRPVDAATCYRELAGFARAAGLTATNQTLGRFVVAATGDLAMLARGPQPELRDELTGAYSHRRIVEHMRLELERCRRYGRVFSVLLIDIDNFRYINDAFGRSIGDDVLRRIAAELTAASGIRSSDVIGRRGGDQFCVILPETAAPGALSAAERLRRRIERVSWHEVDPRLTSVTVSAGASSFPQHGDTVGALLEAAVGAQVSAKRAGKNRAELAGDEMNALKKKVAAATATPEEVARFEELQREFDPGPEAPQDDDLY
jgi:diguanylate cyclase (GGDEF)-like protein